MNDLDKIIAAEAVDQWDDAVFQKVNCRLHPDDKAELLAIIKSACKKAVEESWRTASTEYRVGLIKDKPAHAREHRVEHRGKHIDIEYFGAAHRVENDAAGASDDNCRKCGRSFS